MAKTAIEESAGEVVAPPPQSGGAEPPVVATPPQGEDPFYPVLAMDPARFSKVIRANIGNARLTEFDVDRISVPTGGGNLWTVPTLDGDENAKDITGIVVYWKEPRAYWKVAFDESGGGTPPDCSSDDGVNGIGEPGGACGVCPLAQFGTHHKGRGQACKQMRVLFMVREQEFLPIAVSCPPTSLGNMQKFFLRLAGRGIQYNHIVTRLTLGQDKNKEGIKYSAVEPAMVRMLNEYEIEQIEHYCASIEPALSRMRVAPTATEFAG